MSGALVLSEPAMTAMRMAAARRPSEEPLTTGLVLAALAQMDSSNVWKRIWLYSGDPEDLRLCEAVDSPAAASAAAWEGIPLTRGVVDALSLVKSACETYDLAPASTGLLALAMVADPENGAARTLIRAGLPHSQLLELIQSDVLGTRLAGLGELIASHVGPTRSEGSLESLVMAARARATGRPADELDFLSVATAHPATQESLQGLGIDEPTVALFERPARAAGLRTLDDAFAESGLDVESESPASLVGALAANPSCGLAKLFKEIGVSPSKLAVEAADLLDHQAGRGREVPPGVIAWGAMSLLGSLLVSVLIVVHAVGPGGLWELLLVPLVWQGFPRWSRSSSVASRFSCSWGSRPWPG